jgi:hypothetical protein
MLADRAAKARARRESTQRALSKPGADRCPARTPQPRSLHLLPYGINPRREQGSYPSGGAPEPRRTSMP